MSTTEPTNYDNVLDAVNNCLTCMKNGGRSEDILYVLLNTFDADDAVFLSAGDRERGVDTNRSFVLRKDRTFLERYAENYWQLDPLYNLQFSPGHDRLVFKTDDVIPFSQLVNLEYYDEFLRPQDLLGELIIRLCSEDGVMGAISLQRCSNHPGFEQQDIKKAQLIVPLLVNIFDFTDRTVRQDNERLIFENWMEAQAEGILLLDADFRLLYRNAKADLFCARMNNKERHPYGEHITLNPAAVPKELIEDCRTMANNASGASPRERANRIVTLPAERRYYIQYFPLLTRPKKPQNPSFMIFINELAENEDPTLLTPTLYRLSEREELIAKLAASGMTNKQIAERLCISHYTVQNHLKSIFEKTGLDSRTKLANLIR